MVTIQQDRHMLTNISNIFDKNLVTNVEVYTDMIQRKADKYREDLKYAKGVNKHNIKGIIKWLERIISKVDENGNLEYSWELTKDFELKTYPVEVKNIEEYGIHFVDVIKAKENQTILRLDYTNVANLIAFELMHKDMEYTHADMEDKLKEVGIVGIYDIKYLFDKLEEDDRNAYMLSKKLKIGKSYYKTADKRKIVDYFNLKTFNAVKYKDVVHYSCERAILLILEKILNNLYRSKVEFSLCMVTNTEIDIVFNDIGDFNIRDIVENAIIRVLGRKFEVKPKVQIY